MAIRITKAHNIDLASADLITKELRGKLYGDKAYISKDLFAKLYSKDLRLFTGIRKCMKNHLLELEDKVILRKH